MINIETILNIVQFLAMIVFGYSILLFLIEENKLKNLAALDKTILSLGIGWLALILLSLLISDLAVSSGIVFSVVLLSFFDITRNVPMSTATSNMSINLILFILHYVYYHCAPNCKDKVTKSVRHCIAKRGNRAFCLVFKHIE